MQELETSPPSQNPTSGGYDATRAHTIVLGDSLASIANTEYGTPTVWRAIAIANRLEDPFNLRRRPRAAAPERGRRRRAGLRSRWPQHGTNAFKIEVDGSPLSPAVASALLEASVEDEINLPDAFELVFRDPLRTVIDAGRFAIGKALKISVVSEAAAGGTLIFDGEITALEAEIDRDRSTTIVRGLDPAHRLQRGTNTETHLDVTYGDIVGKVAQRRGLQQGDGGTNTVVHEAVVQWNQTDWEFLSTLAAEIGHEIVVAERKLHLREPGESSAGPPAGRLSGPDDPRKLVAGANLLRLRATVSGAEQVEEVEVRGWDYKSKEAVTGTAKASDTARSASAGTGAATLAEALGGGTLVKSDLPVESNETAQDAADSLIEQLGSAAAELEGVGDR